MKNISFSVTIEQFERGIKDVTRRLGWLKLRPGDRLRAVDRVMGFKAGQKPRELGIIEVVSVRREPLGDITPEDVAREGFPGSTPAEFVSLFCSFSTGVTPDTPVTRIEFRRTPPCHG